METSLIVSIIALLLSFFAFGHSIQQSRIKRKMSISIKRITIRDYIHQLSFKLVNLIGSITKHEQFQHQIEILETLNRTAEGLIEMHRTLNTDVSHSKTGNSKIELEYEDIHSKMKEFERVLENAEKNFKNEKYSELINSAKGLKKRLWGKKV